MKTSSSFIWQFANIFPQDFEMIRKKDKRAFFLNNSKIGQKLYFCPCLLKAPIKCFDHFWQCLPFGHFWHLDQNIYSFTSMTETYREYIFSKYSKEQILSHKLNFWNWIENFYSDKKWQQPSKCRNFVTSPTLILTLNQNWTWTPQSTSGRESSLLRSHDMRRLTKIFWNYILPNLLA